MTDFDQQQFEADLDEFEEAEMDAQVQKWTKWQQKKMLQASHADQQRLWSEVLAEEGLDQNTYNQLASADPQAARDMVKRGMKGLVQGVKARVRDSRGRFVSSPQSQVPGRPAQQPSEPFFGVSPARNVSSQDVERVRAKKAAGRDVSDDELDMMLDALLS